MESQPAAQVLNQFANAAPGIKGEQRCGIPFSYVEISMLSSLAEIVRVLLLGNHLTQKKEEMIISCNSHHKDRSPEAVGPHLDRKAVYFTVENVAPRAISGLMGTTKCVWVPGRKVVQQVQSVV